MTSPLAQRLRGLPIVPEDAPDLDVEALPADPIAMLVQRLERAITMGVRAPHAMSLATSDAVGVVSARVLILKDADEHGLHFATHRDSFKMRQIRGNPRAAVTMMWPAAGEQVRAYGPVVDLGDEASAADFSARGDHSRAGCVTGRQGEELADRATHAAAFAAALERVRADPAHVEPGWRAMALVPEAVELWHSSHAGQVRVVYERGDGSQWRRFLRWP